MYLFPSEEPGIGSYRLHPHPGEDLALGIRFGRLENDPRAKSKPFASICKALEVSVEVGNVYELVPGRVEIPAPSRHIGLRRTELSAVARRRLHQPLDRIGKRERCNIFFFAPHEHDRDPQLQRAFHRGNGVFHGRLFGGLLVEAQPVEQQHGAQRDDAYDDDQLDQGESRGGTQARAKPRLEYENLNVSRPQEQLAPYPTWGGIPQARVSAPIRRGARSEWARSATRASSARIRLRADTFRPLHAADRPVRLLPRRPRSSAAPRG